MKGILQAYVRISNLIVTLGGYLSGILIFLIAGMIFFEIVSRTFFNAPTTWATEMTVYALIGSAFLGAAYTLKEEGHIRVDLLLGRVSEKTSQILLIITYLFALIFSLILLKYGMDLVLKTFRIGLTSASVLRIPMYIPYLFIPVGSLLLALQCIQSTITTLFPDLKPRSDLKEGQLK